MADSNNNDIEYRSRSSVGPSPGNGTYYVEIIRESATSYKVEFFSDSSYSGSLGSTTQSIDSTLTDLKYIVWKGSWDQRNESAGYVDDIEFWDGSCF